MRRVRLDVDLGELPDEPEALYAAAHLVNVAAGGHAGDDASMRRACRLALRYGAEIGAHPSYPDRPHFGRRSMPLPRAALQSTLRAQLAALGQAALAEGARVTHLKAHGALYHDAARDPSVAEVLIETALESLGAPAILAPPRAALADAAEEAGLVVLVEGFADRGLGPDGALLPRAAPGAMLDDVQAVRAQALRLRGEGVYDVLCVHGDGPRAAELARAVREALDG